MFQAATAAVVEVVKRSQIKEAGVEEDAGVW